MNNTTPFTREDFIRKSKQFRKELDDILQRMKSHRLHICSVNADFGCCSDIGEVISQHTISIRDLESAIMRQGMVLKSIGNPSPYPESKNPESSVVEPTADGLKL